MTLKKFIIGLSVFVIIAYFGLGFYVYSQAVATTCSIYEPEANNTPDNFSLGEKASWDPSKYFVDDYEDVEIQTEDGVVLSGWYMENDPSAITIVGMHGVTSSKFSPDVLLVVGGMLYKQGFNYLTFAKEIIKNSKVKLFLVKDCTQLAKFLKKNMYGKKIVVGMGAGSISNWMKKLPQLM